MRQFDLKQREAAHLRELPVRWQFYRAGISREKFAADEAMHDFRLLADFVIPHFYEEAPAFIRQVVKVDVTLAPHIPREVSAVLEHPGEL